MSQAQARVAAETAARTSYGRLVSIIARRTRDIAAAEDALSDAFSAALRVWPEAGVPERPDAWLLTAARRAVGHGERHAAVRRAAHDTIEVMYLEGNAMEPPDFPDERLKLLFVCAHPAIDKRIRTALIVQTVLGVDAARIARAFLIAPVTMSQRLVRAKLRIRDAGIAFREPDRDELPARLGSVLSAIYAAYTLGVDAGTAGDTGARSLAHEAEYLARLVAHLMPREPEPKALLALILYNEARIPARRSADGAYVPLSEQDSRLWRRDAIVEAEALLVEASGAGRFGRFQTEAAIQSLHVQAAAVGRVARPPLLLLYDALVGQSPTIGALVARAAAYGEHKSAADGLALLDELPPERVASYQPFWAARFHLLARLGVVDEAQAAGNRAMALTDDPAIRAYLALRFDGLPSNSDHDADS